MNVSLLRDNKLMHSQERRGSRMSMRMPSRQPSMVSLRPHSPNPSIGRQGIIVEQFTVAFKTPFPFFQSLKLVHFFEFHFHFLNTSLFLLSTIYCESMEFSSFVHHMWTISYNKTNLMLKICFEFGDFLNLTDFDWIFFLFFGIKHITYHINEEQKTNKISCFSNFIKRMVWNIFWA